MTSDVGHELGAIRHIVDTPLSSKVAMFNKVASQHNASQLLNPFSNVDGRGSPKPIFSKDEYGKPIAGSMTEMRGQKANIHVCKEMLELCQIIDAEGFTDEENPDLKIIYFGDLFNLYNYISDKVVGLLLRARKHKLLDFEGEMLFQRRDDEVPIFMLKPIKEIRSILEAKQEEFRRSVSPAPQPTSVLQDRMKRSVSPQPKRSFSKSPSPAPPNRGPTKETPANQASKEPAALKEATKEAPKEATKEVPVTTPAPSSEIENQVEVKRIIDNVPTPKPLPNPIITHITDPDEVQRFLDDLAKTHPPPTVCIPIEETSSEPSPPPPIITPPPAVNEINAENIKKSDIINVEVISAEQDPIINGPISLSSPPPPTTLSSLSPSSSSSQLSQPQTELSESLSHTTIINVVPATDEPVTIVVNPELNANTQNIDDPIPAEIVASVLPSIDESNQQSLDQNAPNPISEIISDVKPIKSTELDITNDTVGLKSDISIVVLDLPTGATDDNTNIIADNQVTVPVPPPSSTIPSVESIEITKDAETETTTSPPSSSSATDGPNDIVELVQDISPQ